VLLSCHCTHQCQQYCVLGIRRTRFLSCALVTSVFKMMLVSQLIPDITDREGVLDARIAHGFLSCALVSSVFKMMPVSQLIPDITDREGVLDARFG